MMTVPRDLVVDQRRVRQALLERQGGVSDRAFARVLGISPTHYNHFRRGTHNFSPALLARLMTRYPELAEAYADDMQDAARAAHEEEGRLERGGAA